MTEQMLELLSVSGRETAFASECFQDIENKTIKIARRTARQIATQTHLTVKYTSRSLVKNSAREKLIDIVITSRINRMYIQEVTR